MIRLLGYLLRGLTLLGLAGAATWALWPLLALLSAEFNPSGAAANDSRLAGAVSSSAVYLLDQRRWLEFPILGAGKRLKVISNASVSPEAATLPDSEWRYALRYQLVDNRGRVLRDAVYHHQATVTRYQPPGAKQALTAAFYLDPRQTPTDGRVLMIDLAETPGAERLRLQQAEVVAGVAAVAARVYLQEHLFDPVTTYRWQRINRSLREMLAQASLYGSELLHETEQVNLLRQRWTPTAPLGIEKRDYRSQRIYITLDIEAEPVRMPVLPAGLYVDRSLRGILPIPEPGGPVKLEVLDAGGTPLAAGANGADEIQLFWYGPQPAQRATYRIPLAGAATSWTQNLSGGLLEVLAPCPLVIRATLTPPGAPALDLIPEPLSLRLYRLESGRPLEFAIAHLDRLPTFWRVDLRLTPPDPQSGAAVRYELLDAAGATLRQGELAATGAASIYDRLSGPQALIERISEPASYGFALPTAVNRVRLTALRPVLATAYTRPPDLRREVRVPEDYQAINPAMRGQPTWFSVAPLAAAAWVQDGLTVQLNLQSRPPQIDPEVLAGRYDWQDYDPGGDGRGRYLLNPRDPQPPLREQALGSVFRPLTAEVPLRVELQGLPGRQTVEATLLMLRETDQPGRVEALVDGQSVFNEVLALRRAQIRLPPLPAGSHTVVVRAAQPARWYLNYAGAGAGSLTRRLAYRLDSKGLEFTIAKTSAGPEILSGVLQTPFGTTGRSRLRVTVEQPAVANPGPFTRLTVREWLYDIQPDNSRPAPVLDTPAEQVGLGQRFFLPLGDDWPLGDYRIRMRLEEGSGYLTLYRVVPGTPTGIELFNEEPSR